MKNEPVPLIFIPSPRRVKIVWDHLARNVVRRFDTFVVKNHPALEAYNIGAKYFLENKQYTHFCLIPDDLIVNRKAFDILLKYINKFDVVSGVCNLGFENKDNIRNTNVTLVTIPDLEDNTLEEINKMWLTFDQIGEGEKPLKVAFAGLPVTFIKRSVMEKMKEFRNNSLGVSRDAQLSKFLMRNNIDQYIIPAARFIHLRSFKKYEEELELRVGKDPREVYIL